jgi:uncharacterized protein (TIGR01777 family)
MAAIITVYRSRIAVTPERLLAWHANAAAFERLTPPWADIQVVESVGSIEPGAGKHLHVSLAGPIGFDWRIAHEATNGGPGFRDVQVSGPFRSWRHDHQFLPDGDGGSVLEDRLTWEAPFAPVTQRLVTHELDRTFALRHRRTGIDLARQGRAGERRSLRIAVTGASGLIGSRLVPFLRTQGHEVVRISRSGSGSDTVRWNPAKGEIDAARLDGLDAVIHLAGTSIAGGRWTSRRKAAIRDSRIAGTTLLAETMASLRNPPAVLVSTSAIGIYGDRGDAVLDEGAAAGEGFLADVCVAWEAAADPARAAGIRVVHPRFGVVFAGEGGLLPLIAKPFQLGLGGPLGDGRQYLGWIGLDDLVGILLESVVNTALAGPVNAVAPEAVTNRQFTATLGGVLGRPAIFSVPAPLMRIAAGQLADELILASQRVSPSRLEEVAFPFAFPTLESALRHELGRPDWAQESMMMERHPATPDGTDARA